jgi:hypothetical protein
MSSALAGPQSGGLTTRSKAAADCDPPQDAQNQPDSVLEPGQGANVALDGIIDISDQLAEAIWSASCQDLVFESEKLQLHSLSREEKLTSLRTPFEEYLYGSESKAKERILAELHAYVRMHR